MNILCSRGGKFIGIAAVAITLLLCLPLSVAAQGDTEIILDPTAVEAGPGETFTVTLRINNVPEPGMAAYDFRIIFTPGDIIIDSVEVVEPTFGEPMALAIDNDAGYLSFCDALGAMEGPSGNITLANIRGTAVSAVSATEALHFDKADIINVDGEPIPATVTVTDGEVEVYIAPEPGVSPDEGTDTEYVPDSTTVEPTAAPAKLLVRNLRITPTHVQPDQQVTIYAEVANDGGIWGSQTVNLMINGQLEQAVEVGVSPGDTQPVDFTVRKLKPGKYEVEIGSATGAFYVIQAEETAPATGGVLDTGSIFPIVLIGIIIIEIIIVVMLARRVG